VPGFGFSSEFRELKVEEVEPDARRYRAVRVTFLSDRQTHPDNDKVSATVYFPKGKAGQAPAVLVFSILGGEESLSRGIGRSLARSGIAAFVVDQKKVIFRKDKIDLSFSDAVLRQAVVDARKAVSWLQERPEVDKERIGVVGISIGGILASLVASVEPRIKASVWMLAGADLVELLANTREPSIRRARETLFATSGLTAQMFIDQYRNAIISPEDYVGRIDPSSVLMLTASFDRVVPRRNARLLWEAAGRPQRRLVPLGHFSSIAVYPLSKRWVIEFFQHEFGMRCLRANARKSLPHKD
jgi:acetyl esterase/lipase